MKEFLELNPEFDGFFKPNKGELAIYDRSTNDGNLVETSLVYTEEMTGSGRDTWSVRYLIKTDITAVGISCKPCFERCSVGRIDDNEVITRDGDIYKCRQPTVFEIKGFLNDLVDSIVDKSKKNRQQTKENYLTEDERCIKEMNKWLGDLSWANGILPSEVSRIKMALKVIGNNKWWLHKVNIS